MGPKQVGSLKLEPLNGRFFDIKPSPSGKKPALGRRGSDYFRFAVVAILAFLALSLWNAYVLGCDLVFESSGAAKAGYDSLKNGMDSLMAQDAKKAADYFSQAESSFYELSQTTAFLTEQTSQISTQSLYLDTAGKLIEGATEVTQLGQKLAKLLDSFSVLPAAAMLTAGGGDSNLIDLIQERRKAFEEIVTLAGSIKVKLDGLNDRILPSELRAKLISARDKFDQFSGALGEGEIGFDAALTLLGDQVPHRFMVLLQNNNELRATGGFIGSYLLVDVNDGKITKMEAHDVYETDGQLQDLVPAPAGIDQVASRLYMRDANYSPDFPTSAQKIMWFLEHSRQPSVDTVVAIDQSVVEELLRLTGPVSLGGFGQVGADNFSDTISFYTEAKLSDTATPKQLLFDLIPTFQKKLGELKDMKVLADLGQKLLKEGHVQAYSSDPQIQGLIARVGLDGSVVKPDDKTDYLGVVTTAIGGNKSDRYIKTDLTHRTVVGAGGKIEDELTIKKTHTFDANDLARVDRMIKKYGAGKVGKDTIRFIMGQGPNVDYMRVYVPLGSVLQEVKGIDLSAVEVTEDLGYTVFGFKLGLIKAGQSKELTLRYLLPFELSLRPNGNYQFIADHQAGARNVTLKKEIQTAEGLKIIESYPPADASSLKPMLQTPFDQNQIFMSSIGSVE